MKIPFKTALISFIIILFSGLIVIHAASPAKMTREALRAQGILNSFEILPSETALGDFDLETNGYVALEQMRRYATNGRHTLKAVFSVPSEFMEKETAAKAASWIAPVTMSINTLTRLKVTDWSAYRRFAVDVYNPEEREMQFGILLIDDSGKRYETHREIKNGRNRLEIILEEVKNVKIGLDAIVSITLFLDTIKEEKPVTLYIDYIRLVP